jgi:hypothetical protein
MRGGRADEREQQPRARPRGVRARREERTERDQMEPRDALPLLGFRRRRTKHVCPASAAIQKVCRIRASKRWSALLTQTKSRIGFKCGMRKRLGEVHWAAFVKYAEDEHKASFVRALTPAAGMLCCEGKLDGTACPKAVVIDLKRVSAAECAEMLPRLHMDHTHDIKHICEVWSKALPERPEAWDDGICGPLLAHLLFGTEDHVLTQCSARPVWRRQIVFRGGSARGVERQRATDFCHDLERAHYGLRTEDIQWPRA